MIHYKKLCYPNCDKKRNNIYIFFNSILHYNNHQKVKIICIKKTMPGWNQFLDLNVCYEEELFLIDSYNFYNFLF